MVPLPDISNQNVNRLKKYLQPTSFNDLIIAVGMCALHYENNSNRKTFFLHFHVRPLQLMGWNASLLFKSTKWKPKLKIVDILNVILLMV